MKNKDKHHHDSTIDYDAMYQWYIYLMQATHQEGSTSTQTTFVYTEDFWGIGDHRAIDGSHNNDNYAGAGGQFFRMTPSDYGDGFDSLAGQSRPSARVISNEIFATHSAIPDSSGLSDMMWVWGQFIDHDIDLTRDGLHAEYAPIDVPMDDPYFGDDGVIHFFRSGYDPTTGEAYGIPREQINEITAFLDASMIYGSDEARNAYLRDENGKLKISDGDLLPFNEPGFPNAPSDSPVFFLAGDVRANENVGLTSLHILFVREHNRLVDELKSQHPEFTAEELYQYAKLIVEAEIQAITYNDFLPLLLGPNALDAYSGFDPTVDPEIANIFATAAYRFGHSMLSAQLYRLNEAGGETAEGHLSLKEAFFNPLILTEQGGIDAILRGASAGTAEAIDTKMIDDVRNFLFGEPGAGGLDLGALNIQRGRDHGLPDYNTAREAYGLDKVTDFSEITSDPVLQQKLAALYGSVDNIDVFVGGLAEDPYPGSKLGELFHSILVDQFTRIRDGDYYFYANRLDGELLEQINNTHLSDIILRNTDIEYLQENVFIAYNRIGGDENNNHIFGTDNHDLLLGFDGNDFLKGFADNDELYGGAGNDRLYGYEGDDLLHGETGNDYLKGDVGNDRLYGEAGIDILEGGAGNDILNGGAGRDKLIGGEGSDIFVLAPFIGQDKVMDFSANDFIDVSAYHITYAELIIESYGNNTTISVADPQLNDSLDLLGVIAFDMDPEHFIF